MRRNLIELSSRDTKKPRLNEKKKFVIGFDLIQEKIGHHNRLIETGKSIRKINNRLPKIDFSEKSIKNRHL